MVGSQKEYKKIYKIIRLIAQADTPNLELILKLELGSTQKKNKMIELS
jgi:predicted nucleic acid-binding protein